MQKNARKHTKMQRNLQRSVKKNNHPIRLITFACFILITLPALVNTSELH